MSKKVKIIKGDSYKDERGILYYNNEFNLHNIKRTYSIFHSETTVIRAWQVHYLEHKYFKCIRGEFLLTWKRIGDNSIAQKKHLKEHDNVIVSIPCGYANGLKAIEENSEILIFSNLSLEESIKDRKTLKKELWFDWDKHLPIKI